MARRALENGKDFPKLLVRQEPAESKVPAHFADTPSGLWSAVDGKRTKLLLGHGAHHSGWPPALGELK